MRFEVFLYHHLTLLQVNNSLPVSLKLFFSTCTVFPPATPVTSCGPLASLYTLVGGREVGGWQRERERDEVNIYTYNNRKHQQCRYTPHKTQHMYTNNSASLSVNSVTFTGSFCSTKVSPPLVCTEIQYTDTQLTSDLETGVVC